VFNQSQFKEMRTILKYRVITSDYAIGKPQEIMMHKGAEILTAQLQAGQIQMWAMCFDVGTGEMEDRTFILLGTGRNIDEKQELNYIATIQDDEFVWHLFEIIN
jgi:hypothetical protein